MAKKRLNAGGGENYLNYYSEYCFMSNPKLAYLLLVFGFESP
jgi:hypothetical protein